MIRDWLRRLALLMRPKPQPANSWTARTRFSVSTWQGSFWLDRSGPGGFAGQGVGPYPTRSETVQATALAVRRPLSDASEGCAKLSAAVVAEQAAARAGAPGLLDHG